MDLLLPVAPGALDGSGTRFYYGPRFWRDIPKSDVVETEQLDPEPVTVDQARVHLHIATDQTDDDPWLTGAIVAARRQVERDAGLRLPRTKVKMTFDQFPLERWISLPEPPLVSVQSVSSFDILTGVETTMSSADYLVDTDAQPGRVCLVTGKIWPVGVREFQGGKIAWTAGYTAAAMPARYVHAMKLLIGHWDANREAVTSGANRYTPDVYPLGYEALIGVPLVSVG